jgi:hypothetical protein
LLPALRGRPQRPSSGASARSAWSIWHPRPMPRWARPERSHLCREAATLAAEKNHAAPSRLAWTRRRQRAPRLVASPSPCRFGSLPCAREQWISHLKRGVPLRAMQPSTSKESPRRLRSLLFQFSRQARAGALHQQGHSGAQERRQPSLRQACFRWPQTPLWDLSVDSRSQQAYSPAEQNALVSVTWPPSHRG